MSFIKYIADERSALRDACPSKNHYKEVLSLVGKANMYHTKRVIDIRIIRQLHKTTPVKFCGTATVVSP